MPIDLDNTEEMFAASTDLTVGLEEEFAVLDRTTLDLVPRFEELRDAAAQLDPVLHQAITGELISSEIEIVSGRGEDLHDAIAHQRDRRRRLFTLATNRGIALGSTGTHPWADYREQRNIDTDHYRRVVEGLGYVARRNNTFSLHVHVGVRGADRAVAVCDRLRPVLPALLAVSASSPFLEGQDTLLHSARSQIFTKSFPRCGVPDAFGDWRTFRDYLELLIATGSIVEYTQVWWSVRPHASFGTVEVRICDAQVTAAESEGLAALVVACVGQALRDIDEGVPFEHPLAQARRGEHVARDPPRPGRQDDRPRARGGDSRARRGREAVVVDGPRPRRGAHRRRARGPDRRPAPARGLARRRRPARCLR